MLLHRQRFYFYAGVTMQLHHQTTSWRWCSYANVLSFLTAVFHQFFLASLETTVTETEWISPEPEPEPEPEPADVEQQF